MLSESHNICVTPLRFFVRTTRNFKNYSVPAPKYPAHKGLECLYKDKDSNNHPAHYCPSSTKFCPIDSHERFCFLRDQARANSKSLIIIKLVSLFLFSHQRHSQSHSHFLQKLYIFCLKLESHVSGQSNKKWMGFFQLIYFICILCLFIAGLTKFC